MPPPGFSDEDWKNSRISTFEPGLLGPQPSVLSKLDYEGINNKLYAYYLKISPKSKDIMVMLCQNA